MLYYYILKWTAGQGTSPWIGNGTIFQYTEPNFVNPVGVLPCQRLLYGVGNYRSNNRNEYVCGCAENAYVSEWGICTCLPGFSGTDLIKKPEILAKSAMFEQINLVKSDILSAGRFR